MEVLPPDGRPVERRHELAVGCTGGVEVVDLVGELTPQFDDVLFEIGDAALQGVDVVRGAEAGHPPRLVAEGFGQAVTQLSVLAGEAVCSVVGASEVGEQGGAADVSMPSATRGMS